MEVKFPTVVGSLAVVEEHLCWKYHVLTNVMSHWLDPMPHSALGGWADPSSQAGLGAGVTSLFSFTCMCCQTRAWGRGLSSWGHSTPASLPFPGRKALQFHMAFEVLLKPWYSGTLLEFHEGLLSCWAAVLGARRRTIPASFVMCRQWLRSYSSKSCFRWLRKERVFNLILFRELSLEYAGYVTAPISSVTVCLSPSLLTSAQRSWRKLF